MAIGILALGLLAAAISGCGGSAGGSATTPVETTSSVPAPTSAPGTNWRFFGRVYRRSHYLAANINPPVKQVWQFNDRALIEYPPALANGVLYVSNQYGDVRALRARDGRTIWDLFNNHRTSGPPVDVTGPAYSDGRLYIAREDGLFRCLDAKTGKTIWARFLRSELESSPLVVGNKIYMGTDKGDLVALSTKDGHKIWDYFRKFPVRSSPSYVNGVVYSADYGGSIFAVNAKTGKQIWRTDTSSGLPPGGRGGFYSSASVENGLVYVGRDDGTVYAVDQRTGKLRWFFQTGAFVYGSPAVADPPGKEPSTVYIGSYSGFIYALNALTGKLEWKHHTGPVPGTATVIGRTAYTSSFKFRHAYGIDTHSHRRVFSYPSPGYTPMISDGKSLFLAGYFSVHRFVPKPKEK